MWPWVIHYRWEDAWMNVLINFFYLSKSLMSQLMNVILLRLLFKSWKTSEIIVKRFSHIRWGCWRWWCVVLNTVQEVTGCCTCVSLSAVWPTLMAWVLQSAVGEMWAQRAGIACVEATQELVEWVATCLAMLRVPCWQLVVPSFLRSTIKWSKSRSSLLDPGTLSLSRS